MIGGGQKPFSGRFTQFNFISNHLLAFFDCFFFSGTHPVFFRLGHLFPDAPRRSYSTQNLFHFLPFSLLQCGTKSLKMAADLRSSVSVSNYLSLYYYLHLLLQVNHNLSNLSNQWPSDQKINFQSDIKQFSSHFSQPHVLRTFFLFSRMSSLRSTRYEPLQINPHYSPCLNSV